MKFVGQRGLLGERIGSHPSGVDGDWLSNWKKPGDGIRWLVDIVEPGSYEMAAMAKGLEDKQPISFQLTISEESHAVSLAATEQQEEWQYLPLQRLDLNKGVNTLAFRLKAQLPTTNTLAIRGLSLKKLE